MVAVVLTWLRTLSLLRQAATGELKDSIALVNASDVTCIESMHRLSLKLQACLRTFLFTCPRCWSW